MSWLKIALCGAFGGVAPSLLELAGLAKRDEFPGQGYLLALAIFALLGGGVALIHKEEVLHKAFFLGIAAPALIVAAGTLTDKAPLQHPLDAGPTAESVSWLDAFGLSSTAYAEPAQDGEQERETLAAPVLNINADHERQLSLKLDDATAREVQSLYVSSQGRIFEVHPASQIRLETGSRQLVWNIPSEADSIFVTGEAFTTSPVLLPQTVKPIDLRIERSETFWSGFFTGLGMENRAKAAKVTKIELVIQ